MLSDEIKAVLPTAAVHELKSGAVTHIALVYHREGSLDAIKKLDADLLARGIHVLFIHTYGDPAVIPIHDVPVEGTP